MKLTTLYAASLALTLILPLSHSFAQDRDRDREMDQTRDQLQTQIQDQEIDLDGYPISGYGMMSQQERERFGEQMRSMTPEQRQAYRLEHHERMRERARAQGVDIEDLPPTAAGPQGRKMNGNGSGKNGPGGGNGSKGPGRGGDK